MGIVFCSLWGPVSVGAASGATPPDGALTLEVSQAELAAARALGPDIRFFTSRARPLRKLDQIREPGQQLGSADVDLARGLVSLLRAGGVKLPRAAPTTS